MKITQHKIEKINVSKSLELPFNRPKVEKQVKVIGKSIVSVGLLRVPVFVKTKVITGKYELYSLDGQHLIEACKRLDIKNISGIVVETDSIFEMVKMMALLNNVHQRWTLIDYVKSYCGTGNADFFALKNHAITNGFTIAISASILSGTNVSGSGCASIKNGTFKVNAVEQDVITQNLIDVSTLINTTNAKFHKAYLNFYRSLGSNYNHKRMITKIQESKDFVKLPHDQTYLYDLIHKTYTSK
jgi:hypothetical protein